jgi:hypothetical protein
MELDLGWVGEVREGVLGNQSREEERNFEDDVIPFFSHTCML